MYYLSSSNTSNYLPISYSIEVRMVDRPDAISKFFNDSNVVDKHNQSRQFDLALEKKWVTHNPCFHLITTLMGIACVDTWFLACYYGLVPTDVSKHYSDEVYEGNIPIKSFAGALSQQLISMGNDLNSRKRTASEALVSVV